MVLKRLELFGFKSFCERLDVSFSDGITAIVGPNGSGKSNISDAVRWVLGEQSPKQLRGANMADVIFKGTETRKPLSYCEVSLVFDNTDRGLDIDYTEVVITRRLYRSGESEYYINRTGCRLKDIVTLFQDTGIGKEGYSLIGQGRIENLLSGKQEERRNVFEEAAGIVKYKTRKNEAERKLNHTKDNLMRINDIIDTLAERIEPLGEQAETAKAYLSLREQLKKIEVNFYIVQNELAEQRRANYNQQLEGIDQEREEKTLQIEKFTAEIEKLDAQVAEKEESLAQIRAKLLELTAKNENASGQQQVFSERINNILQQIERVKEDLTSNEARKKSMLDAINGDENAKVEKQIIVKEKQEAIAALEADVLSREDALAKESAELEELKAEMIANINKLSDVKSNISRFDAMKANIASRTEKINLVIDQLMLQRGSIEDALADQKKKTAVFDSEKEKLTAKLEENKLAWQKLYLEKDTAAERLASAQSEVDTAASRLKVLEDLKRDYEGFNFAVKKLLALSKKDNNISKHIYGVVAEIISVDKKFEDAIEAALGNAMQNIVTPDEHDAKALIEVLRSTNSGRATFLPCASVVPRIPDKLELAAAKEAGCFGFADTLISYDKKYDNIIKNLLGKTLICDNLDTGIKIARLTNQSLKIVTLSGDVMNTGGSISGGSKHARSSSILSRDREIEETARLLKEKQALAAQIKDDIENFDQKCKNFESIVNECQTKIHELEVVFAHDIEKLSSLNNDLEASKQTETELVLEKEQLADTLKEIETELAQISQMQDGFDQSNNDTQASISARQSEYNKKQLEKEKLAQKLIDDKIECAALIKELEAMQNNAERLKELISNLEEAKVKLIGEGKRLELSLEEVKKEQADTANDADGILELLNEFTEKEKAEESLRESIIALSKENEERRRGFEQEIYQAGERRHKIELSLAKVDNDLKYLENRIWEEYELTQATALEIRDPEFKQTGAQTEINRLKREISALGNVNVNAIDEYVETKEKFDSLSSQRDDLEKAEEDLNKIIDELTKKMDKQFRAQFEIINKYFNETFRELFGGGKAELKLENGENSLDADIEIVAQPPGKSLQLLSLLSGGERALTAIAILFAMLKLKPTPFCILDEIEAALDEANVGNFASYLRKFSEGTQFIVITHRKPTMEEADSLYGVAMEEKGVSKIVSVKLT